MKRKTLFNSILILFGVLYLFSFPGFSAEPPQSEETKQIVALVNSAAALIESKGKDVFPEFRKKDSKWYKGETYVFVDDIKGISIVNPPTPKIEGTNVIDLKDAKGKAFIREFIEVANTKGSGWVDYYWPMPGHEKHSQKVSYIKKAKMPDGKMVIVGAGIYID